MQYSTEQNATPVTFHKRLDFPLVIVHLPHTSTKRETITNDHVTVDYRGCYFRQLLGHLVSHVPWISFIQAPATPSHWIILDVIDVVSCYILSVN